MKFRPCIDIHNGCVKQIVGGTLDDRSGANENFVATYDAAYYAKMYKNDGLFGGHVIMLSKPGTKEYEDTKVQALGALSAFPGGLQVGGGIDASNAKEYINAGASHCIFTSYVIEDGKLSYSRLDELASLIGKEHIVLDLSCRKNNGSYYVVTDRWQTFTDVEVTSETIEELAKYCDEFLIHGVDVEGMRQGIDKELLEILAKAKNVRITYAGGIHSMDDIEIIRTVGRGNIDYTVGSALDIFGGDISYDKIKAGS